MFPKSKKFTDRNALRKKRRYLHCCQPDESCQRQSLGSQPASPHIQRYPDRYHRCTSTSGRLNIRTPLQILILILVYPPERQEEKIVEKAGQRGRAHAFGLASNNRNGFLTCKLKRELGTRVHIPVRYDSRVWVQQTRCQRNS